MTEKEKSDKLNEYSERYRFWTDKVFSQFGYTVNLITTIGIGLLGFLISTRDSYPELVINKYAHWDWGLFFYLTSILFSFISVLMGSISIISRLYDLRLTRHLIWARRAVYKDLNKMLPDSFIDIEHDSLIKTLSMILFNKIGFIGKINEDDFEKILTNFEKLRKQSKILGRLSWISHKVQILFLIIAILIFGLTIF